ncbi:hypothetical protein JB92DRAFT_3091898 [Gautieria morchelliformis]|nr:hypothetical protein JB92DRAFT_3091898 [Gautieria morchelliformis]
MSFDPQSIVTALESRKSELTPTKYSWVAALTFMLYDHVTTLDVEVVNVWNRPRSLSKWVFIWTRYFGLASLIIVVTGLHFSGDHCDIQPIEFYFQFCTVYNSWAVISVEAILLIRVYAVYDRNKYILYGLAGLLLLTITGTVILWLLYRIPAH